MNERWLEEHNAIYNNPTPKKERDMEKKWSRLTGVEFRSSGEGFVLSANDAGRWSISIAVGAPTPVVEDASTIGLAIDTFINAQASLSGELSEDSMRVEVGLLRAERIRLHRLLDPFWVDGTVWQEEGE